MTRETPILDDIRLAGERLVRLTGNGPETGRLARLLQRARLRRPPAEYRILGQVFFSHTGKETLLGLTPSTSPSGDSTKGMTVQTITGQATNVFGVDEDIQLFIDNDVLGLEPDQGWRPFAPTDIADRLARIGRLLKYGAMTQHFADDDGPERAVITDDAKLRSHPFIFLRTAMMHNGYVGADQIIHYTPPSPSRPHEFSASGMATGPSPALLEYIGAFASPELKVMRIDKDLRIMRTNLAISVDDVTIVDQMKHLRTVIEAIEKTGRTEDILTFEQIEL